MLAKQGWRLINNPESLLCRIFKARYFPSGSFLEAMKGNCPSFAWKSILEARDVLLEGLLWRIGDGRKVKIWGDKWLPAPAYPSVSSPPSFLTPDTKVSTLIDDITGWWRTSLIRQMFTQQESEAILKTPLSCHRREDTLIWSKCANGIFTVKSAYHVARSWLKTRRHVEGSSEVVGAAGSGGGLWKAIWGCNVPNKVKLFSWRACRGILPTLVNLGKRGIPLDTMCCICRLHEESGEHAIMDCDWARQVWSASPFGRQGGEDRQQSLSEWVMNCYDQFGKDEFSLLLTIAWKIWYHRNVIVHGGVDFAVNTIPCTAAELLTEFREANVPRLLTAGVGRRTWSPPMHNVFKVNCDGATFPNEAASGIGVVIRDNNGEVCAALSRKFHPVLDACTIEAYAIYFGLQLARDVGFINVEVESDALLVILAAKSPNSCMAPYGHIVEDIKAISLGFGSCRFLHVKREANQVAHTLARKSRDFYDRAMWIEETPVFLQPFVLYDLPS